MASSSAKNFPVEGHGDYTIQNPPVSEWVGENQLSDSKFADVAFAFDKKQVFAHAHILCVRCRVLYEMYDKLAYDKKKKKRKGLIIITVPQPYGADYPITAETFELVLQFLYADNIQFETLDARQALDLCNAARTFELPRLVRLCRDRVYATISLGNVHALLKVAHDTQEERVRAYTVHFASKKRKDFIGNKDEIAKIGVDLFQDVMASLMGMDADEPDPKEPGTPPPSTLINDFRKLHTDIDVGAVQGDSSITFKGSEVMFHKSFFAARSKSLSQSFQPVLEGNENTTDILKVKGLLTTVDAFRAILKYLYYGDLSGLTVLVACEVTEFAKTHGMPELQYICEFVMAVNINVDSVMSIMKVVFNPGNIKRPDLELIRKNTLTFFRQNIAVLELNMMSLLQNGPLVMAEIIMAWQTARKHGEGGGTSAPVPTISHEDKKTEASDESGMSSGQSGLAQSESQQSLADDLSQKEDKTADKEKRKTKKSSSKHMKTKEEKKKK